MTSFRRLARNERHLVFGAPLRSGLKGATFTRASEATFLNNDTSLVDTAAIDEARYVTYNGRAGLLHEGQATNLIEYSEDFSNAFWVNYDVGDTVGGSITLPDGSVGTKNGMIADNTNSSHFVSHEFASLEDDTSYTFSVYAKKGLQDWIRMTIRDKNGDFPQCYFDLANGVVEDGPGTDDEGIEDVGDGWYRCWVTQDMVSGVTVPRVDIRGAEDDGDSMFAGDGINPTTYLWGAQLEETPYPTSYIPTGGYTEKDDETGVPEYRIIGKDGEAAIGFGNLITAPEVFDGATTDWTTHRLTFGGSETMPDGSIGTVNGFISTADAATHVNVWNPTLVDDTSYTFSLYAKKGVRDWIRMSVNTKGNLWLHTDFDLANGVKGTIQTTDDEGIEDVGDGWYRCWITQDIGSGGQPPALYLYMCEAEGDTSFTGNGSNVDSYLWGAMLTEGTATVPYLPYYNDGNSRIVLTDGNGAEVWAWIGVPDAVEALGSELVANGDFSAWTYSEEDDETNVPEYRTIGKDTEAAIGFGSLVVQPEDFSNAWWTKTECTVGGSATMPDGSTGTDNGIIADSDDEAHTLINGVGIALVDDTSYTLSVYAKKGNKDWLFLQIVTNDGSAREWYFDLDNGVVGAAGDADDKGIEDVGDGWYRCWITQDSESGVSAPNIKIRPAHADGDATFAGDGSTVNTYAWGAQLTEGAGPCPYLPLYSLTPGARIVLHDGTYTVWGYIGEPDGVEAVDNIHTDDCEDDDTADWNVIDCTLTHDTDHYEVVFVATTQYAYRSDASVVGRLYKVSMDYEDGNTADVAFELRAAGLNQSIYDPGVDLERPGVTTAAKVAHIGYVLATDTTIKWGLKAFMTGAGDFEIDNLILDEVTALGLSAVHIYSEATLATQSWNGDQADFDFNAITSMEVEIDGDPDDWTVGSEAADYYVAESGAGGAQLFSDGTIMDMYQDILTSGRLVKYSIDVKAVVSGAIRIQFGTGANKVVFNSTGVQPGYMTSAGTFLAVVRESGATDVTLDDLTAKEVTAIGLSAVHVYDNRYTQNTTRQNWIGDTANFDFNDIAAMEIEQANAATQTSRATEKGYPRIPMPAALTAAISGSGEGTLIFELTLLADKAAHIDNVGILSFTAASSNILYMTTGGFRTYDGTTTIDNTATWSRGDHFRIAVHWGSNAKFTIGSSKNGAAWDWETEDDYDGAFSTIGTIRFFHLDEFPMIIRNVKIYDVKYSTARIEQMAGG
jgi:hypothetical protein